MSYRWARKMEDKERRISKNSNTTGFYQKQGMVSSVDVLTLTRTRRKK